MNNSTPQLNETLSRIYGIFGTGRSGTTWLGSILNSHPEVAYRFEPFHRSRNNPVLMAARAHMESEGLDNEVLKQVYSALIPAYPALEKPPFLHKVNSFNAGRNLLWPVARKFGVASRLFSRLYTPRDNPPLVFKEVTMEPMMANVLLRTTMPVVYLIRHPFGVISSLLEGQARNIMPTGRIGVLDSLMRKHDPALADRYTGELSSLSPAQLNALLWRMDVEKAWQSMNGNQRALLLFYEDLCKNTEERAQEVFSHFNIGFVEEVKDFISKSTVPGHKSSIRSKAITQKSYFSVYRDPLKSMNKWKDKLDKPDRDAILDIFSGSEAIETYLSHGHWEI